jgi:hypothetical protein
MRERNSLREHTTYWPIPAPSGGGGWCWAMLVGDVGWSWVRLVVGCATKGFGEKKLKMLKRRQKEFHRHI